MKNEMISFLKSHICRALYPLFEGKQPLLLAYSAGVDSQALFHLLLEIKARTPFELHVAHVDHCWRETSSREAQSLKQAVELLKIPFHLITLNRSDTPEGDKENYYRKKRLEAFSQIYQKINAACLLMAHHQDDLAETVFKRLFEGAFLFKLAGLKQETYLGGMKVIRPLLGCEKKHLRDYLTIRKIDHIEDETNHDTTYLRAKQRLKIFPQIQSMFGKNATKNLARLSEKIGELDSYLQMQTLKYQDAITTGPFGLCCDFSKQSYQKVEWEYVIKSILERFGIFLSGVCLDDLLEKLSQGASCKKFLAKTCDIFVDRGLFFVHPQLKKQNFPNKIMWNGTATSFESEDFVWELEPSLGSEISSSWKDLYIGEVLLDLENGEYDLINTLADREAMERTYTNQKVPAFLRALAPAFAKKEQLICNPWIKTSKKLKEKKVVKLICTAKSGESLNFNGLKSTPLLSLKS